MPAGSSTLKKNATAMSLASRSVDGNVIFFLLHELPHHLEAMEGFTCERRTVFFGNFQVIVATRTLTA